MFAIAVNEDLKTNIITTWSYHGDFLEYDAQYPVDKYQSIVLFILKCI
jgi:hypothetical protein